MRGSDGRSGELFSYVDLEDRVPAAHPLRAIRSLVNEVLAALDGEFAKLYADSGRASIAPERLLRALLLQAFYTIRSERQLMEQIDYNLLYRWFVGLDPGIRARHFVCIARERALDLLPVLGRRSRQQSRTDQIGRVGQKLSKQL